MPANPRRRSLAVDIPERWKALIPEGLLPALTGCWPRTPGPLINRLRTGSTPWSLECLEVKFQVEGDILNVCQIPEEILIKF